MQYKSIRQMVHMSQSSEPLQVIAEREYQQRLEGWSTFRSGIVLRGHELCIVNFRELATIVDHIREQENVVIALWENLPPIARRAYIMDLIGAEMQSTNSIEGVRSTRKEISDALKSAIDNGPHKRFSEFAKLFLALSDSNPEHLALPHSLEDIRAIYDQVISGELEDADLPDGDLFRNGPVYIDDEATGRRIHTGITPESEIKVLLTQWLTFTSNSDMPSLLKAAMCHFAFEYIHPFYDGNGRTGRFLFAMQLRRHLSVPTAISLSPVISDSKNRYYKAFEEAQHPLNCCDVSLFAYQMMKFIADAQRHIIDDLSEKRASFERAKSVLYTFGHEHNWNDDHINIIGVLIQEELFGVQPHWVTRPQLRDGLALGRKRVNTALDVLIADKAITTVGERPVYYSLSDSMRSLLFGKDYG
ncbi:cell division protein Fic [Bifidobacterium goeldii]|uniref:Cell division protein Fic n=1 Tax=Bifidobacterium goeldii TaxID=2306975 RepID=A0A430FGX8_9BIFI|nr:Fic family protein [Bifidobacterium goeldii]RSX52155.1 cell division protein Fic [Bifidobacterium goeldii]